MLEKCFEDYLLKRSKSGKGKSSKPTVDFAKMLHLTVDAPQFQDTSKASHTSPSKNGSSPPSGRGTIQNNTAKSNKGVKGGGGQGSKSGKGNGTTKKSPKGNGKSKGQVSSKGKTNTAWWDPAVGKSGGKQSSAPGGRGRGH